MEKIQERALKFIYNENHSTYEELLAKSKLPSLKIRRIRTGSGHYSDSPLFRQPIAPTAHYSDSPLLRQPISPTTHYSVKNGQK